MEFFIKITLCSGLIPLIVLLFKNKVFNFKEPIVPLIWITAVASVYELLNTNVYTINASYWFQIYPFLEIVGLYYFFLKLFKGKHKSVINLLLVSVLIIYGFSFIFWDSEMNLQAHSVNKSSITLCILIGCFTWFKDLFKNAVVENIWNRPDYYFIIAIFIYYSSTLLLFSLGNFIYRSFEFYQFWWINILATLLFRILLTIGTWKMKRS